jgi:TonB family protein
LTDPQVRHTRGLLVVIFLGLIFFTLLALIVLKTGDDTPEEARAAETLTVLPLRVRIRTEPNARAAVVATATSGETLKLMEDQGAWVRVQKDDGLSGWAERANLERTIERQRRVERYMAIRKMPPLAGVTTRRSQLFAGPGIFYPLVGELPAGTSVRVFTRDHDFFAVEYRDEIAYADIETVDVTASGSSQFDVKTTSATPSAPTDTALTPPTETMVQAPPVPPIEAPIVVPSTAELVDRRGVYSAVPPGGTQPEEIDRVVPRYPPSARRAGVAGAVVIRGIVRRDGSIDDVEIIKDLPSGLGDAARDAVRQWRFRPATYQGEPIDVYYTVTVNFRLQ